MTRFSSRKDRRSVEPNTRSDYDTACAIVCRLGKNVVPADVEDYSDDEIGFVARVLREESCTPAVFTWLDEKPGNSGWGGYQGLHGEWHYRLRRFRNRAPRDVFNKAVGFGR